MQNFVNAPRCCEKRVFLSNVLFHLPPYYFAKEINDPRNSDRFAQFVSESVLLVGTFCYVVP